jgi:hypothetical protein
MANMVMYGNITEQMNIYKYLICVISMQKTDMDLGNIQVYKSLNGCTNIKTYSEKNMMKEIKLRMHNIIAKSGLRCGGETLVLREEDESRIEAHETRFLRPLLGISLWDRTRGTGIRKEVVTEGMVEEEQEHRRKWQKHV